MAGYIMAPPTMGTTPAPPTPSPWAPWTMPPAPIVNPAPSTLGTTPPPPTPVQIITRAYTPAPTIINYPAVAASSSMTPWIWIGIAAGALAALALLSLLCYLCYYCCCRARPKPVEKPQLVIVHQKVPVEVEKPRIKHHHRRHVEVARSNYKIPNVKTYVKAPLKFTIGQDGHVDTKLLGLPAYSKQSQYSASTNTGDDIQVVTGNSSMQSSDRIGTVSGTVAGALNVYGSATDQMLGCSAAQPEISYTNSMYPSLNQSQSCSSDAYQLTANAGFGGSNHGFGGSNHGFGGSNHGFGASHSGFGASNPGFGASSIYPLFDSPTGGSMGVGESSSAGGNVSVGSTTIMLNDAAPPSYRY